MELIQSKSVLARLMAAENITVQHSNVPTAFFDLKSRSLTLPMWKDMDGYMYDLLCGHEVGHALDTPLEGWHSNTQGNPKIKPFLNVIEDARIEKRIKRKFPGLAKSFAQAYRDLYERDFFGINKIDDLNKLNLIDRINLHFKLGAHVIVPFNDEERGFVRDVAAAEKWDDVVDIANRVYNYVKTNEADKLNNAQDLQNLLNQIAEQQDESDGEDMDIELPSGDASEESDDFEEQDDFADAGDSTESGDDGDGEESDDSADSDSDDDSEGSDEESDEESDATETSGGTSGNNNRNNNEPTSITDDVFREREAELVSSSKGEHIYVTLKKPADYVVVPVTRVLEQFETEISRFNGAALTQRSVAAFNNRNKKYIALLVKEFEMRKNATEYARAQTSRSGQLDTSKLFQYRVKNDLFKRVTAVGKGKSHAMQLVFDMSGSMSEIFKETIDQILVLTTFCKRVNIPFEVYGFTDEKYYANMTGSGKSPWVFDNHTPAIYTHNMRLVKFLSSDMNSSLYRRAYNMLATAADQYSYASRYWSATTNCLNWESAGFVLSGTPLTETHIAMRFISEEYKNKTGVDHVNLIIMTDGEGCNNGLVNTRFDYRHDTVYVIDPITKERTRASTGHGMHDDVAKSVHQSLSMKGIKMIGYYIGRLRNLAYSVGVDRTAARNDIKKQGFYATTKVVGFDKYYFMSVGENRGDPMAKVDANSTKTQLKSAFKQMSLNNRANRALAANFAQEIAL